MIVVYGVDSTGMATAQATENACLSCSGVRDIDYMKHKHVQDKHVDLAVRE